MSPLGTVALVCGSSLAVIAATAAAQVEPSVEGAEAPPEIEEGDPARVRFAGLPGVFSSRETGFGFAVFGQLTFHLDPDRAGTSRPSTTRLTGAYTLRRQIIVGSITSLVIDGGRFTLDGRYELRVFPDRYYGLGNTTPDAFQEYTKRFGLLRTHFQWQPRGHLYLGAANEATLMTVTDVGDVRAGGEARPDLAGSYLAAPDVPNPEGSDVVGLGLTAAWDTRDNVLATRSGAYAFVELAVFPGAFGTAEGFTRTTLDLRAFGEVWPERSHVVAAQAFLELRSGRPPFSQMAELGGPFQMRGIYKGRYRDHHQAVLQLDYRFHVVWRVFGAMFASVGSVFGPRSDGGFPAITGAGGFGVRFLFDEAARVFLRADLAFAAHARAFLLQVNEAF